MGTDPGRSRFGPHRTTIIELLALAAGSMLLPALKALWRHFLHNDPPEYLQGALPNVVGALILAPVAWFLTRSTWRSSHPGHHGVRAEITRRNRAQMIQRVNTDWIEGVLANSLYRLAKIDLGLESRPDLVDRPIRTILHVQDEPAAVLNPGTPIGKVFDEGGGALLILGPPGSGKTTLLLELTKDLIEQARNDSAKQIPVVFNLSTWAVDRSPLEQWLAYELRERYEVPSEIARSWIDGDVIVPMLDGLDEVAKKFRQECTDAIGRFRRDHGLLPIAVCCRSEEYGEIARKLRLRTAIEIKLLSEGQVLKCLEEIGRSQDIPKRLKQERALIDLLRTPLMLWIMILAYSEDGASPFLSGSYREMRRRLFAKFVETMLIRRPIGSADRTNKWKVWLCCLASAMEKREQTIFHVEDLDSSWLSSRFHRLSCKLGIVVVSAAICGFYGALVECLLSRWITTGTHVFTDVIVDATLGFILGGGIGLIVGVFAAAIKLRPVEQIRLGLSGIIGRSRRAMLDGAAASVCGVVLFGAVSWFNQWRNHGHLVIRIMGRSGELGFDLSTGLWFGSSLGLAFLLVTLLSEGAMYSRTGVNRATHRSAQTALAVGPLWSVIVGIYYWIRFGVGSASFEIIVGGTALAMAAGGLFSIQHFVTRVHLWLGGSGPLDYQGFLDAAVDRLFLRKVGSGYMFLHRMLLEHFAKLEIEEFKTSKEPSDQEIVAF